MNTFKAKKSLGQNFLIDDNISRKIVNSISIQSGENIIEIGPGTGALTKLLLEYDIDITLFELDIRAVELLKETIIKDNNRVNLIHKDFLKADLNELLVFPSKAIGNLPYYISSQILFKIFENPKLITKGIFMFQKEFAKRLVAKKRTKDYGIMTIMTEYCSSAKSLFDVPPSCFRPQPKVNSSVVLFEFKEYDLKEYKILLKLVKNAFLHRRKTFLNAVNSYLKGNFAENFDAIISSDLVIELELSKRRAEELTLDEYLKLAWHLEKYRR